MIIHMLPGAGKTWLAKHYPATYADGDELYEHAFPGRWKGRVHLLSITERYKALENFKIVLTNDHQIADISVLHSNLQQYLDMASKRPDLKPALIVSKHRTFVRAAFYLGLPYNFIQNRCKYDAHEEERKETIDTALELGMDDKDQVFILQRKP